MALAEANEMLGLPHSIHIHPNDLGHPGNVPTTLETLDSVKNIKKSLKFYLLKRKKYSFPEYFLPAC